MNYAIFRTGGKQYRVSPGHIIDVDKLPLESGSQVELGNVLVILRDGDLSLGRPVLSGARVVAHVQDQIRDKKILVFKYKRKVRYRRKKGHRQPYTRLEIRELLLDGEEASLVEEAVAPEVVTALPDEAEEAPQPVVAEVEVISEEATGIEAPPTRRPRRRTAQPPAVEADEAPQEGGEEVSQVPATDSETVPKRRPRRTAQPAAVEGGEAPQEGDEEVSQVPATDSETVPKRRPRRTAQPAAVEGGEAPQEGDEEVSQVPATDSETVPKRRPRRTAQTRGEGEGES